ncbi:hypothetical protein G6011_02893 [Alternaria panax]|uniref:S-adenosyl-L-methionine-dependent methyltransferase n=1 Tax=Alternaria panax TaxID=48097 RepID=A0AAD4FA80_9PLEO|nr:hypothetical protein G6011_02893 [Alternaria panax]
MSASNSSPDTNGSALDYSTAEEASSSGPSLEIDSEDTEEQSDLSDERDSEFGDSAYGDNQSSYTMSATSSVFSFRYENGRRYHAYAEGKYPVPNDEVCNLLVGVRSKASADTSARWKRIDWTCNTTPSDSLDGKLYRAPIPKDVHNVLDVGCGTGIWSIEFADEHPSARVLGTDLSPIQPAQVPPNCEFLIDDCEADWIFRDPFDFIHTRAMVAAIKNWDRFFEQAYTNLKPGGYLECQDIAFPIRCMDPGVTAKDSPLIRWSELFLQAAKKIGLDGTAPRHFTPQLRNAGFNKINLKSYKWPVGKWAKGARFMLLGRFVYEDLMDWLPSSSLGLFTRVLKWSREEVEVFLSECRAEVRRKDRHYYADVFFYHARKPEDPSFSSPEQDFESWEESIDRDEDDDGHHARPSTTTSTSPEPSSSPTTAKQDSPKSTSPTSHTQDPQSPVKDGDNGT